MESEVALQVMVQDGIMVFLFLIGRVDGFHAHVETKDEIVEIQAHTQSIGHGNLFVELIDFELSSGLFLILPQRPDVSSIDEECAIEFPEQVCAVFHVDIEFHITRLVDEVDGTIRTLERARTKSSDAPSPHRVGTSREIPLLEWQHPAVAIRIGHTDVEMHHQRVHMVEAENPGVVEITFHILGEGDVEECALSLVPY